MQHAASDSISSPPKAYWHHFLRSFSSFQFTQSIPKNTTPGCSLGQGFSVFRGYLRVIANRRCRQSGANMPCLGASNASCRVAEAANILNKKFHLTCAAENQPGGALPGDLRSIGERLWLMLEFKRGLGV